MVRPRGSGFYYRKAIMLLAQVPLDKTTDPSQWKGLADSLGPERFLVVGLMVAMFVLAVLVLIGAYRIASTMLGKDGWLSKLFADVAAKFTGTLDKLDGTVARIETAVSAGRGDDRQVAECHEQFRVAGLHTIVGLKKSTDNPEAAQHFEKALQTLEIRKPSQPS
jgi:hypothetical protein